MISGENDDIVIYVRYDMINMFKFVWEIPFAYLRSESMRDSHCESRALVHCIVPDHHDILATERANSI